MFTLQKDSARLATAPSRETRMLSPWTLWKPKGGRLLDGPPPPPARRHTPPPLLPGEPPPPPPAAAVKHKTTKDVSHLFIFTDYYKIKYAEKPSFKLKGKPLNQ